MPSIHVMPYFQGTVQVSENPPGQSFKPKDRRIFLFEQSMIMADCILPKKEFSNPQYIYKAHILVSVAFLEWEIYFNTPNVPRSPADCGLRLL